MKRNAIKKSMSRQESIHRYVDYHSNRSDFLCIMLASIGFSTEAIVNHLNSIGIALTEGQVVYRISKAESGRVKGEKTSRSKYRSGNSEIASAIIATASSSRSPIKSHVTSTLSTRGLFEPRSNGVLRHQELTKRNSSQ